MKIPDDYLDKKEFKVVSKPNSPREFDSFWYESLPDFCKKNKKVPEVIKSYGGKSIRKAVEEITRKHWSQG